jgi:hypothetical protein
MGVVIPTVGHYVDRVGQGDAVPDGVFEKKEMAEV